MQRELFEGVDETFIVLGLPTDEVDRDLVRHATLLALVGSFGPLAALGAAESRFPASTLDTPAYQVYTLFTFKSSASSSGAPERRYQCYSTPSRAVGGSLYRSSQIPYRRLSCTATDPPGLLRNAVFVKGLAYIVPSLPASAAQQHNATQHTARHVTVRP